MFKVVSGINTFTRAICSSVSMPPRPRWSAVTLVTMLTSQCWKCKATFKRPHGQIGTAKSTVGSFNTNCALTGPVQSPFMSIWFCIYTPSLVVYPPLFALLSYRYAPLTSWWWFYHFVPVTAIMGMRPLLLSGTATYRSPAPPHCAGRPAAEFYMHAEARRCIYLRMAPPFSLTGVRRSGAIMSMPQMSRPMIFAMRSHITIFSGCISSVTSVDVPPVKDWLSAFNKTCSPFAGTVSML